MVIRVLDHVARCFTYEDGEQISRLVKINLNEGGVVTLSFDGVLAISSSFLNGLFKNLEHEYGPNVFRSSIKVTSATSQIAHLIKERVLRPSRA